MNQQLKVWREGKLLINSLRGAFSNKHGVQGDSKLGFGDLLGYTLEIENQFVPIGVTG